MIFFTKYAINENRMFKRFCKVKKASFFPYYNLISIQGYRGYTCLVNWIELRKLRKCGFTTGSQGEKTGICVSKPNKGNNNVNLNWIDKYKLQNL